MLGQKRTAMLCFSLGLLLTQVGCVALNIPSQRFHDPTDKGGLLGHWKTDHRQAALDVFHDSRGLCLDGGPLEDDPLAEMNRKPPAPEVPWPRFHPVPTRPIFGSSDL